MANLLDRLLARAVTAERAGYAEWMYSGAYPVQTMDTSGKSGEAVHAGVVRAAREAYKANGVVFGVQAARQALFSEARFKIQRLSDGGLFGAPGLSLLERPWPNATSGELLGRMSIGDTTAGQAFFRLVDGAAEPFLLEMRPDTVMIVSEIQRDSDGRPYKVPVGYLQDVRAIGIDADEQAFKIDEVAHFSPNPDPDAMWKGMSWLTPIMKEFQVDQALSAHKVRYLEHGALPGIIVKSPRKLSNTAIKTLATRINARHGGPTNTGRTLILDEGVDAIVAGHNLEQIQADLVAKAGERRIAAAGGVPLVVLGLESGDYQAAVRRMADLWARPMWRMACACLEHLVASTVPPGCRLWHDVGGIAALREGELARGQTTLVKVQAVAAAVTAGFSRESSVIAAESGDVTLLEADPDAPTPGSTATSSETTSTSTTTGAPGGPGGGALNGRAPQAALTQTTSGRDQPHLPASRPQRPQTTPRTPLPSRAPGVRRAASVREGTIYPDGSVIYRNELGEVLDFEPAEWPSEPPPFPLTEVTRWRDYIERRYGSIERLAGQHVPGEPYRYRHGWIPVAPYFKTPGDLQAGDVVNFRGAKHMVLPAVPGQESSRSRVFLHRLQAGPQASSMWKHPQHEATARPHEHGLLWAGGPKTRAPLESHTVGPTEAIQALGPNAPLGFGGVGARPPRVRGRVEPEVNPEGIKAGDRVRHKMWPSEGGNVRAVDEEKGLAQLDNGFVAKLDMFTKLPPPPMTPKAGDTVRRRRDGAGGVEEVVMETTGWGDNRKLRLVGSPAWEDAKEFAVVRPAGPSTHEAQHLGPGQHIVTPPGEKPAAPARTPKPGDHVTVPGQPGVALVMSMTDRGGRRRVRLAGETHWRDASDVTLVSGGEPFATTGHPHIADQFHPSEKEKPAAGTPPVKAGDQVRKPDGHLATVVGIDANGVASLTDGDHVGAYALTPATTPAKAKAAAAGVPLELALHGAAAQNFLHAAGGLRRRGGGEVNAEQVMAEVPPKLGEPAADYYRRLMTENIQKHGWEWGTHAPAKVDKRVGMKVMTPGGETATVVAVDESGRVDVRYPGGGPGNFFQANELEWPITQTGAQPPHGPAVAVKIGEDVNTPVGSGRVINITGADDVYVQLPDGRIRHFRAAELQSRWGEPAAGSVQRPVVSPEHLEPEGEPERVMVVGHVLVPEQTKLAEAVETGVTSENEGDSGVQGETLFWTMANGERAVHKTLLKWSEYATAERCASAEYLSAQVAWAIGETNAPPIIRGGSDAEIIKGFVDGVRAEDADVMPPMTPGARNWRNVSHIGVLDYLVANNDQHTHNYFVLPNGEFSPIDNSSTFGIHGSMRRSPFAEALHDAVNMGQTPISMRELDQIELRLKGLRGAFDEAGEGVWLDQVLNRLQDLRRYEQQGRFPENAIDPHNLSDEGWIAATSQGGGGAAGPGGLTDREAPPSWGFF